jgi:hypothetical protein
LVAAEELGMDEVVLLHGKGLQTMAITTGPTMTAPEEVRSLVVPLE